MALEDDIHEELVAISARLGLIDGKTTLNVRANRDPILATLKGLVDKKPQLGQIYLLLDGKRSQHDLVLALRALGISTGDATVHRHLDTAIEHGIAELVIDRKGAGNAYRKDPTMESVLSLSKNIRKWLEAAGETLPPKARKAKAKKPKRKR